MIVDKLRGENMKKIINPVMLAIFLMSVFISNYALADRGRDIIEEAVKKGQGYEDSDTLQELITTDSSGKANRRLLRVTRLEGNEKVGDKILLVVREPQTYKGMALLTHGMLGKDEEQWTYNRRNYKVRRVSPIDKAKSFSSSEFTFEDLGIRELDDYTYRFIKETEINGKKTFEVEAIPVDPKSGYSRQVAWLDQENLRILKIDFYDKDKVLEKTRFNENYQLYSEKYWRAHLVRMVNHKTNRKSEFIVQDKFKFNVGLTEKNFTTNELQRIR